MEKKKIDKLICLHFQAKGLSVGLYSKARLTWHGIFAINIIFTSTLAPSIRMMNKKRDVSLVLIRRTTNHPYIL